MFQFFAGLAPVWQALIATMFTWLVTLLGASLVFFLKDVKKNIMNSLLGFSAGVMLAASFWSLLNPSVMYAEKLGLNCWLIVTLGFISGGVLLYIGDKLYDFISLGNERLSNSKLKRSLMLISSITLHNIPEGAVIGVAFGSIAFGIEGASLISAITLAIGIGIQNFPEGSAVSLPLLRDGYSRFKAFFLGQLSGIVEPIAAVIGVLLVIKVQRLLPFLLSFAAGAMIYVAVSELIPESQGGSKKGVVSMITIIGFAVMTLLDIALG